MSVSKIVIARKEGRCWNDFAHPYWIERGDRIRVTTGFPGDDVLGDYCTDGKPIRVRECTWCLDASEHQAKQWAARA